MLTVPRILPFCCQISCIPSFTPRHLPISMQPREYTKYTQYTTLTLCNGTITRIGNLIKKNTLQKIPGILSFSSHLPRADPYRVSNKISQLEFNCCTFDQLVPKLSIMHWSNFIPLPIENIWCVGRHDICQKNYATAVLGARILRKKCVNRDISQFATKERKCFKWPNSR